MSKHQWILEGLAKPGKNRVGLARALNRKPSMVTDLLKGNRELKASEIPIIASYPDVIPPSAGGSVRIIGRAGRSADGLVEYLKSKILKEAPMPPGGAKDTVAVEIEGDQLRGIAQDGSLLYYERPEGPPTDDMLGELCIVGLADERVLLKFLHQGRGPGLYDLESSSAPTLRDVPVTWASLITAIIPGPQARKLVKAGTDGRSRQSK